MPRAGVLLAVAALIQTGVFECARESTATLGPAFYGLRTSLMTMLLMALLRIKRPEALKEHAHVRGGIAGLGHKVAALAIGLFHPLRVLIQLAGVEGGKQVLKNDGVWDADRLGVDHGVAQNAVAEVVVALKGNLADFDRGPLLDPGGDAHRRRRDGLS